MRKAGKQEQPQEAMTGFGLSVVLAEIRSKPALSRKPIRENRAEPPVYLDRHSNDSLGPGSVFQGQLSSLLPSCSENSCAKFASGATKPPPQFGTELGDRRARAGCDPKQGEDATLLRLNPQNRGSTGSDAIIAGPKPIFIIQGAAQRHDGLPSLSNIMN
jgi:hypothetical protein